VERIRPEECTAEFNVPAIERADNAGACFNAGKLREVAVGVAAA